MDEQAWSCVMADGAAIAALTAADPAGPVPTCPDWTMQDLADHVSGVYAFATASLLAADGVRPPRPTEVGPVAEQLDALLALLRATDPDELRPTLLGPRPVRWWLRRLHHESAIHRVDAERGAEPAWITPACAHDGIAELVDDLLPVIAPDVALVADRDSLRLGDDEVVVTGAAVDRFLLLWGRRRIDDADLVVRGDPAAWAAVTL